MGAFCADRVADHSHMFRFYKRRVAFFSKMDFNRHAIVSLDHIQAAALRRIDAILEVKCALERPAEDIAATRMNRANMLGRLGRFGEAKAELDICLQIFQNNPTYSAKVLGSLATCSPNKATWPRPSPSSVALSPSASSCLILATAPSRTTTSPITLNAAARRPPSPNPFATGLPRSFTCLVAGLRQNTPDLVAQLRHPLPPRPCGRR